MGSSAPFELALALLALGTLTALAALVTRASRPSVPVALLFLGVGMLAGSEGVDPRLLMRVLGTLPFLLGTTMDGCGLIFNLYALRRLPHRRRACVVLRYAFDLSEREVADTLYREEKLASRGPLVGTSHSRISPAPQGDAGAQLRTLPTVAA